jgi:hypothetical protein
MKIHKGSRFSLGASKLIRLGMTYAVKWRHKIADSEYGAERELTLTGWGESAYVAGDEIAHSICMHL